MTYSYRTAVELLDLVEKTGLSLAEIAVRGETEIGNQTREELLARMTDYYGRMKSSVAKGLAITQRSQSGLSGGDARRVLEHSEKSQVSALGTTFERSLAYGLAVLETNAAFGQIVATPTAGSAGIAPACLLAWQETRGASDEDTAMGLWTAAAVGKIIGYGACFSGAQGGCQAEVGSACSMAAAALCELDGGTPKQVIQAAAMALKNTLGLICDPIGGYVEAPCSKRNALYTLHAFGASTLALSGVESVIPFDEVVGALREVGRTMPRVYKETAEGGLAITPTGLKFRPDQIVVPLEARKKG
ncbi:L-serine ammonia-lyase, iron-sulfur-dependent, subunit alpha [bacterium]|nr:MAG: L-serine ammonia-lyase, iron-sulfur-dependent, subunit alpha [bacterium]